MHCCGSTLAFFLDGLVVRRDRKLILRVVGWSLLVAGLCLPYFVYTQGWSRDYLGQGFGLESPARFIATLRGYLLLVHLYAWPFLWTLLVAFLMSRRRTWDLAGLALGAGWLLAVVWSPSEISVAAVGVLTLAGMGLGLFAVLRAEREGAGPGDGVSAIALLLAISILLHSLLASFPYFRYLAGLLPFFALATALTVDSVAGKKTLLAAVMIAALCSADVLPRAPLLLATSIAGWPDEVGAGASAAEPRRSDRPDLYSLDLLSRVLLRKGSNPAMKHLWIRDYAFELVGDYDGPVEAVVRHLWSEAGPDDAIIVRYEHYPFMFYTDLRVLRWDEAASLERLPEWVFFHGFRREALDAGLLSARDRYRRVPLEAREVTWENIPEPYSHLFETRRHGPRVELYRLRDEGASESAGDGLHSEG